MAKTERPTWKIPWKGIIFTIIFSMVALIIVFSKVANPKQVLRELEQFPTGYFFGALFFVLAAWLVDGQRIGVLTRAVGHYVPWWQLTLLLGAANFLTLVTPFAGGGGAMIIYFFYRRGLKVPTATAIVVAGGLAGQIGLSILSFIMFWRLDNAPQAVASYLKYIRFGSLAYFLILVGLIVMILRSERFFEWVFRKRGAESRSAAWLAEFRATFQLIVQKRRGYFLCCLVFAFSYYIVYYMGGFVLFTGFQVFNPWLRLAISVLFGIAPVFSPIPGGAGASELIAYVVLDGILTKDALGTFIILWRTVVFYLPILFGGTIFTVLALQWAASAPKEGSGFLPKLRNNKEEPSSVILSEEDDHTR